MNLEENKQQTKQTQLSPDKEQKIQELTQQNNTRYKEIKFQCDSIDHNVQSIAANLEEIYTIRDQAWHISSISTEILRHLQKLGISEDICKHALRKLDDKYKRTVDHSIISVRNSSDLPEEFYLTKKQFDESLNTLKNVDYRRLTREYIQEIAEQVEDLPKVYDSLCKSLNIALPSEITQKDRDAFTAHHKDEYAEPVRTPQPVANKTIVIDAIDAYINAWQKIRREVEQFPPQVLASADRIAAAIYQAVDEIQSGVDRKYKAMYDEWIEIMQDERDQGKHAAHSMNPLLTANCANKKCNDQLMEVVVTPVGAQASEGGAQTPEESEKLYTWVCPRCKGTEQKQRLFTREQIGDKKEEMEQWIIETFNKLPDFLALIMWYKEWKQPYTSSQTVNLSEKLSDRSLGQH